MYSQLSHGKGINKQQAYFSASLTFLTSTYFKGNFIPASSTGLAAGGTLKDAILQGIYEILEHDAWMIGQANMIKLPLVDIATSKNENLYGLF